MRKRNNLKTHYTPEEYRAYLANQAKKERKPREMREQQNQVSFFQIIDLDINRQRFPYLEFITASSNGAHRGKYRGWISKLEGQRSGFPDIILPFVRRAYPGAFMENKIGKKTLDPNQEKFKAHLVSEGYCFQTTYTVDQQCDFVDWYLGITLVRGILIKK